MALFNTEEILDTSPKPVEILLGHLETAEGREPVTVTLRMTDRLREVFVEADDLYIQSPRYSIKDRGEGRAVNNYPKFCEAILKEGYLESQNILSDPSKEAMIAVVHKELLFAAKLARKLREAFLSDERLKEMEDDEKN